MGWDKSILFCKLIIKIFCKYALLTKYKFPNDPHYTNHFSLHKSEDIHILHDFKTEKDFSFPRAWSLNKELFSAGTLASKFGKMFSNPGSRLDSSGNIEGKKGKEKKNNKLKT